MRRDADNDKSREQFWVPRSDERAGCHPPTTALFRVLVVRAAGRTIAHTQRGQRALDASRVHCAPRSAVLRRVLTH
jgi:hypothetical protein